MTVTKKYLRDWEKSARIRFTDEQKRMFFDYFGEEPYPHEWSEQDIYYHIRNYIVRGYWEKEEPIDSFDSGLEILTDEVEF